MRSISPTLNIARVLGPGLMALLIAVAIPATATALESPPYPAKVGPAPEHPVVPLAGSPFVVSHGASSAAAQNSICTAVPFIVTGGNHIWDFEADSTCSQDEWQQIEACPTLNGEVQKGNCDESPYELSTGVGASATEYCKGYTAKTWMWYYTPYLTPKTSTEFSNSGKC